MRRWTTTIGVTAALAIVMAACGKSATTATSTPQAGTGTGAAAATTGTGAGSGGIQVSDSTPAGTGAVDKIVWDLPGGEPFTGDWAKAFNYPDSTVLANECENLQGYGADRVIKPRLAQTIDHPDPLTYVYHLRTDVTFWDGTPMTSADAVYSLERNRDPKKGGGTWSGWFENVASIAATDAHTVTIKLTKPDTFFNEMLASPAGTVGEKAYGERVGDANLGTPDHPVMCTGPYSMKEWVKGDHITLVKNDHYWDTSLQPKVGQVTFKFLTQDAQIGAALVSGAIDGSYEVPFSLAGSLENGPGKEYFGRSWMNNDVIVSNLKGPLGSKQIRQALRAALDYKGILATVLRGQGELLRAVEPPGGYGASADILQAGYDALPEATTDLAKAKALVQAAGPIAKRQIVIGTSADLPSFNQHALALQDAAKKIGLDVTLKSLPANGYITLFVDPKARVGIDGFMTTNYSDIPDPLEMYLYFGYSKGFQNYGSYVNPAVDKILLDARATDDATARANAIVAAQKILTDDLPWIPIDSPYVTLWLGKRITGAPTDFVYLYSPWVATLGAP